jgi:hypothetical protein
MPDDLHVHDVSIRFAPSRYLRISNRVLTPSTVRFDVVDLNLKFDRGGNSTTARSPST